MYSTGDILQKYAKFEFKWVNQQPFKMLTRGGGGDFNHVLLLMLFFSEI